MEEKQYTFKETPEAPVKSFTMDLLRAETSKPVFALDIETLK